MSRLNIDYGRSLVDRFKIKKIIDLLSIISNLPGDIAEVGVYRGGTAKIICDNVKKSNIYLFDTFEGMPFYDKNIDKTWTKGTFNEVNYEKILDLFKKYPNVSVHKGIFPQQTSHFISKNKFKFLHLDVDNYQSYKDCLNFFYDKMVSGGIIVFDDYDCSCCPGANLAVDEFFSLKKEKIIKDTSVYIIKQ